MFGGGGVTEGPSFMHAPDTIRRFGDLNRLPGKDRQEIILICREQLEAPARLHLDNPLILISQNN